MHGYLKVTQKTPDEVQRTHARKWKSIRNFANCNDVRNCLWFYIWNIIAWDRRKCSYKREIETISQNDRIKLNQYFINFYISSVHNNKVKRLLIFHLVLLYVFSLLFIHSICFSRFFVCLFCTSNFSIYFFLQPRFTIQRSSLLFLVGWFICTKINIKTIYWIGQCMVSCEAIDCTNSKLVCTCSRDTCK